MTYYDRSSTRHVDGTSIFKTAEDRVSEQTVANWLATAWRCELHSFGELAPVDWYAVRQGRIIGVLELKTRSHTSTQYPTVFLNVRKWLALQLAAVGLGVPAVFVVRFTNGVWWTRLTDLGTVRIGGCGHRVKAQSDIEPVFELPVANMQQLLWEG